MKKLISIFLSICLVVSVLSACGGDNNSLSSGEQSKSSSDNVSNVSDSAYDETITIDVFSTLANYQGIATGWWAKIVKDKFNIELNMIAPNVSGGGDTLYQTRVAGGELGDIVIVGADKMSELVTGGLLLDMSDYIADYKELNQYTDAIENVNSQVEDSGVWGIPLQVSSQTADTPSEGVEPTFGPYLRWDLYKELGYPEMNSLDDLLDVLEDMQNLNPETETGNKAYALSLFPDWDANILCCAKQPTCYYGYDELGYVLAKADGSEFQDMLGSDSMYIEVLEFFNEAYRRGLVDPESSTQTYDTMYQKYVDGEVLFSFWPWLGQSAYNTAERMEEGKGFMLADVGDMEIFSYGCEPLGTKTFIGIGSKAKDPERLADFINWLYSPEGITSMGSDTDGAPGPEGLTWELQDGNPVLTEFGQKALIDGDADVPEEWGGGSWKDGMCPLNIVTVNKQDINPETKYPYMFTLWDSYQELIETPLRQDWSEQMKATTSMEYLKENDKLLVAPGSGYLEPEDSADIATLRGQIKGIVVPYSWQMVYAETVDEFNSLLSEMQETTSGLGYQTLIDYDMQRAKDQQAAREAAVS